MRIRVEYTYEATFTRPVEIPPDTNPREITRLAGDAARKAMPAGAVLRAWSWEQTDAAPGEPAKFGGVVG